MHSEVKSKRWGPRILAQVAAGTFLATTACDGSPAAPAGVSARSGANTNALPRKAKAELEARLEVAHAVMVTVELDFGPKLPTIADALAQIERRSKPDDGVGRTFAVLDA